MGLFDPGGLCHSCLEKMQVPMQLAPQSADPNPGATCSFPPGSYLTLPRFLVPDLEYVVYHSLCIHVPPWSCGRAAYGDFMQMCLMEGENQQTE